MKKIILILSILLSVNMVNSQNTILWSISKPDSNKTSYLFGTFHQMGNSFVDNKPEIIFFLEKSNAVIFESIGDRYEEITKIMLDRPDDFSYRNYLKRDDFKFLERYTTDWDAPISKHKPAELLVRLKQEYIKRNCGTIKSKDTSEHMDEYLQSIINKEKIEIIGLETRSEQFNSINYVNNEEITWKMVKDAFSDLEKNFSNKKFKKNICATAENYMKMDIDYQFKSECTQNEDMLSNRNEKWIPIIENSLQNYNSVFIAVGLLHLKGQCGIIEQLRNSGYEVNPINF